MVCYYELFYVLYVYVFILFKVIKEFLELNIYHFMKLFNKVIIYFFIILKTIYFLLYFLMMDIYLIFYIFYLYEN